MNKWTIIFLIYADLRDMNKKENPGLKAELDSMIKDIKETNLPGDVKILIIQNILETGTGQLEDTTILYSVDGEKETVLERKETPNAVQKKEHLGAFFYNIHNNEYDTIKKIKTKAEQYILITWDHGSAFGIFKHFSLRTEIAKITEKVKYLVPYPENNDKSLLLTGKITGNYSVYKDKDNSYRLYERKSDKNTVQLIDNSGIPQFQLNTADPDQKSLLQAIENADYSRFRDQINTINKKIDTHTFPGRYFNLFKNNSRRISSLPISLNASMLANDKMIDILTNEELRDALNFGFGNKKLDVLLMMNCTMMNLHTMYALRNQISFLVAPAGEISNPGYNYRSVLDKICDTKTYKLSGEELSKNCVATSGYTNSDQRRYYAADIDNWEILSFKLDGIEAFQNTLMKYTQNLEEAASSKGKFLLRQIRNKCRRFDSAGSSLYFMVDVEHFLAEINFSYHSHYPEADELKSLYNHINTFVKNNLIGEFHGATVYSKVPEGYIKRKATGLSLYFPDRKPTEEVDRIFINSHSDSQSEILSATPNWLLFLQRLYPEVFFNLSASL